MKGVRKSANEPPELAEFRQRHEKAPALQTWKKFKTAKPRREAVKARLRNDQRGLCAYCEINLIPMDESVEHFVPRDTDHSRELDWTNLLLCCSGGERPLPEEVADGDFRYQLDERKTCGHAKLNSCKEILNPLNLPSFPCCFRVKSLSGEIAPAAALCKHTGVSPMTAATTIKELGLATGRLNRARLAVVDAITEMLSETASSDEPYSDKRAQRIAAEQIPGQGNLPAFFTTIRALLGEPCEEHLRSVNYRG